MATIYDTIKNQMRNYLTTAGIPSGTIIYENEQVNDNVDFFIRETLISGDEAVYTCYSTKESVILEYDLFQKVSSYNGLLNNYFGIIKNIYLQSRIFNDPKIRIRKRTTSKNNDQMYNRASILFYIDVI